MRRLRFGITPKLTLLFVLFAAGLLAGLGTLAYLNGRASLEAATQSELLSKAVDEQIALDNWVNERLSRVVALADTPSLIETLEALAAAAPGTPEAQAAHDRLVRDLQPRTGLGQPFLELFVIEPAHARVIAATNPAEEGKYKETLPYFINGQIGPYVQNVYYSTAVQGPAMTISAPLRAADGRLLGVLAGRLNLEEMTAIIQQRTGLRQTDDAFLVNTSSLFVTQPRLVSDPAVLQRGVHTEAVNRCLTHTSGVLSALDYRGVPAIIVYRWLPEREVCLIVKMDEAEAFAPVRAFGRAIVLVGGLALVAASLLAFELSRAITRPVLALQAAAVRFGRGELEARAPEAASDELGQLASEFNLMAAAIAEKDARLRGYAAELERRVEERTVELARSNAELEQFAYVASHDLQEPLRMVASYTQLLAKRYMGQLDADADEFIAYAVDGATRMQTLINDLLTYSRVGTRGKPFEHTDTAEVLGQALVNLQVALREQTALVTHDELPVVVGDASQLVQLFQNLIGNAVKFHSAAPPRVHVSAQAIGREWVFAVRDNGIGFEPQFAERIFVVFQRLHTKAEYPGTGIGLALCKKIVERHGGRIWVESQPGEGATFYFTLPKSGE